MRDTLSALTCLLLLHRALGTSTACESLRAEMLRRQVSERGESLPVAYNADALNNLKHKPYLRVQGKIGIAVVGLQSVTGNAADLIHPMTFSTVPADIHWIDTIWVEDQNYNIIGMRRLSPEESVPAALSFQVPAGTTSMTAYQHCNKHGTFKGQAMAIVPEQTVSGFSFACNISNCFGTNFASAKCSGEKAEYNRLYAAEFSRTVAVDGNTNKKHKPSVVLNGDGTATVTVGQENVQTGGSILYHPMTASNDTTLIHWVNSIWVEDQTQKVIAMKDFVATDASPATFTFNIPSGTTSILPYEYCNKHGLYVGDNTVVPSAQATGTATICTLKRCKRPIPDYARSTDCGAMAAEAKRKHQALLSTLTPTACDAQNTKHCPYIVLQGTVAKVVVGKGAVTGAASDPIHPMVADSSNSGANMHFIDTIWVEDQTGALITLRSLSPSEQQPATLYFDIPPGTTSVRAYEYCNIHGLFKGDAVAVQASNIKPLPRSGCTVQQCVEGNTMKSCQIFTAELLRLNGQPAKDDSTGKHKPYLMVSGTTATIVVGQGGTPAGGLIHPMSPSSDPSTVHYISYIFARDQNDVLIGFCQLLPTDTAPATCVFEVPPGVTKLKPYEFCNKHGLYYGSEVTITQTNPYATRSCTKRDCTAGMPYIVQPTTTFTACDALRAEMLRRQVAERGEASPVAYDADALNNLKHKPFLRVEGRVGIVVVGMQAVTGLSTDLIHPMTSSAVSTDIHWIDTIWVEDQNKKIIGMRRLSPDETAPAAMSFLIPEGTTSMTAYEHCNKHGTFKGQEVQISSIQTNPGFSYACNISRCIGTQFADASCVGEVAEWERLHKNEFSRTVAVDGNTNLKHKPSLVLNMDGTATVTVGQENVQNSGNIATITLHPMIASSDTTLVHWINSIWVKDQAGTTIAMKDFVATDPSPARFSFKIPIGTTSMTAYEYCNKHGLFKGDAKVVPTAQATAAAAACTLKRCKRPIPRYARGTDCSSFSADAERRHVALLSSTTPVLGSTNEKHNPYIVLNGQVAKVVVGKGAATGVSSDPIHPMVANTANSGSSMHFIDTIWVEDQNQKIIALRTLSPTDSVPATMYFDIPPGTTSVTAYEYCNIHGLFQGSTVTVTAVNIKSKPLSGCSVQQCVDGTPMSTCANYTYELRRREGSPAKDDPTGKHKPYLMISGTTATIVVGQGGTPAGGLIHPMTASPDKDTVHFISQIYARDQNNNLVGFCDLFPTDSAPATCIFEVPPGVTQLTPYEYCNKHGLYVGSAVTISSTNPLATAICPKRSCTSAMPTLSAPVSVPTGPTACDAIKAEMLRRQVDERGHSAMVAYDADALGNVKHKPFLKIVGRTGIVIVGKGGVTNATGDLIHPMTPSSSGSLHWIDTIWVEDQDNKIIGMRRLSPSEPSPAVMSFPIPANTTRMTAYEHCNKHGLFKGQTVLVTADQTNSGLAPKCNVSLCSAAGSPSVSCAGEIVEYQRLYQADFARTAAVDGNTNKKHKPSLVINVGGTATVTVGKDNVQSDGSIIYHPMTATTDGNTVHWVNAVWVRDQSQNLIAMREFLATDNAPAQFTFTIPSGTTSMTAYEYCNKHGLFVGDLTSITLSQTGSTSVSQTCSFKRCKNPVPRYARGTDCGSIAAEAKRRHLALKGTSTPTLGSTNEKHNPYIILQGKTAQVVVGKGASTGVSSDPIHPMVDDPSNSGSGMHFIDTIWVEDQNQNIISLRTLLPNEATPATLYFEIPPGTTKVTAYEYCNIHGLFQGNEKTVTVFNIEQNARYGCSMQQCLEGTSVPACANFTHELRRRAGAAAKNDATGKHTPYLMMSGTTATIVVGQGGTPAGGLIHPMAPSTDPATVHYISHIFARDQNGDLVAFCDLLPTDPAPATCAFEVPAGVTSITPYEYCNKHGLYVGSAVTISNTNQAATATCLKRDCTSAMPTLTRPNASAPTGPTACDAIRSEMLRRQVAERGETSMVPYDADALQNFKHKPYLRIVGTTGIVVVGQGGVTNITGDLIHPMTPSASSSTLHWIDTIWVEDQDGKIIGMRRLSPSEAAPATLSFPIPFGTTGMTAYEHCNKHGLFKGQTLVVDPKQTVYALQPVCNVSQCSAANMPTASCLRETLEFDRLYQAEFSRTAAVDGNTNKKHKPTLLNISGGTATVKVGEDNVQSDGSILYHPMVASQDPTTVHWVNAVWVKDQTQTIIAMKEFKATDGSPAQFTFNIPTGTTTITAYEYCNKHGLFVGDTATVTSSQTVAQGIQPCSLTRCKNAVPTFARLLDCNSLKAEAERRHNALKGTMTPTACSADEKHCPYIVLEGMKANVVVGKGAVTGISADPIHPMTSDPKSNGASMHYIDTIWVVDQNQKIIAMRTPGPSDPSPATLYFDIPPGTTKVRAYQHCNIHGLFEGTEVSVTSTNTKFGARSGCTVQKCWEGNAISSCQAFLSEFDRREAGSAKNDPTGKHKPFLTVSGTTATIVVGAGAVSGASSGLIHPMTPSNDASTVHYVSHIWARDQMNNLVALCELLPTHASPATCTFEVPPGVIFLRPYEFCNKHGLYVGDMVMIAATNSAASKVCHLRTCAATQPSIASAPIQNQAVLNTYSTQQTSNQRIGSYNMCELHKALFVVSITTIPASHSSLNSLIQTGSTASDEARRIQAFTELFPNLTNSGGQWIAREEVKNHTGITQTSLNWHLLDFASTEFSLSQLNFSQSIYADGVDTPFYATNGSYWVIHASFAMNWGYARKTSLNPHFTIFYSVNFTNETVEVALCGKTKGWMGMGWLTNMGKPNLMYQTDMVITYVDAAGNAYVEDRFALTTEEPRKDEQMQGQRQDDITGAWTLPGRNDLYLRRGALGVEGKEWCGDTQCSPGFTIVQFSRQFTPGDLNDTQLPKQDPGGQSTLLRIIYAFHSTNDPANSGGVLNEHNAPKGYADIQWDLQCPGGKFLDATTNLCKFCDKGSFRPSTANLFFCISAPLGAYVDITGADVATPCPNRFTTLERGSKRKNDCVCPGPSLAAQRGRFHVPNCPDGSPMRDVNGVGLQCAFLNRCEDCPEGTTCRGGNEIRNTDATIQAKVATFCQTYAFGGVESCDSTKYCIQYPDDVNCVPTTPFKQEGYYVEGSISASLYVYRCPEKNDCPQSKDMIACAPGWKGRVCWDCVSNDGGAEGNRAKKCDGCPAWSYTSIPLALIFEYILYRATVHAVFGRASASYMLLGNLGVAVVSLQSLNVLIGFVPNLPDSLEWILRICQIFQIRLDGILPGCKFGDDFGSRVLFRLIPWSFVVFGFIFLYVLMYILSRTGSPWLPVMDRERTFNAMGLLWQTLFVNFAMESVAYWVVLEHPSGENTLADYPDVEWGSSTHFNMIWLHLLQLNICVIFFFAYVCYIAMVARLKLNSRDVQFMKRNAFILARWRPGWFWWGIVTLSRNLILCMIPAIFKQLLLRALLMVGLLMLHACGESFAQPWRTSNNNLVDVGCSYFLTLMAIACTSLEENSEYKDMASTILTALFGLLVAFVLGSFPYAVWVKAKRQTMLRNNARASYFNEVLQHSETMDKKKQASNSDIVMQYVSALSDYDSNVIWQARALLRDAINTSQLRMTSQIITMRNSNGANQAGGTSNKETDGEDKTSEANADLSLEAAQNALVNAGKADGEVEAGKDNKEIDYVPVTQALETMEKGANGRDESFCDI